MNKKIKTLLSIVVSITLIVGSIGIFGNQSGYGDVSNGSTWGSFSIHGAPEGDNSEDNGELEKLLKSGGRMWATDLSKEAVQNAKGKLDAYCAYGECAKFVTNTDSSYTLDIVSTGWTRYHDSHVQPVILRGAWGVKTTKTIEVEMYHAYNISFKIKSSLKNEIVECKDSSTLTFGDKTVHYTTGTGKYNYIKHVCLGCYGDSEEGYSISATYSATYGNSNVLSSPDEIELDSRNMGYVNVEAKIYVPNNSSKMHFGLGFGSEGSEYPDEHNMHGTVEVKDFCVVDEDAETTVTPTTKAPATTTKQTVTPAKNTKLIIKQIKGAKKSLKLKWTKVDGALGYKIQYSPKKNFKKKKTIIIINGNTTSKTIKKLKRKKKYYVRMCFYKTIEGLTYTSPWTKKVSKKTK